MGRASLCPWRMTMRGGEGGGGRKGCVFGQRPACPRRPAPSPNQPQRANQNDTQPPLDSSKGPSPVEPRGLKPVEKNTPAASTAPRLLG